MQRIGRAIVMTALFLAIGLVGTAQAEDAAGKQGGRTGGRGGFGGFGGFGPGGGGFDKVALIRAEQVRKELKVTEEQGKKIDEILAAYNTESRALFQGGPGPGASAEERAKAREEATKNRAETTKKREALTKKTEGELAKILTKDQTPRLDEIALQQQGADALVTESVVAALKLSAEQVTKLKGALKARDDEMTKLRESMPAAGRGRDASAEERTKAREEATKNRAEMTKKREELTKKTEADLAKILTKEQTELLTKMKGKAFTIDMTQMMRRGGPAAPGGGAAGAGQRRRPTEEKAKE
jgi:hypothetical protein